VIGQSFSHEVYRAGDLVGFSGRGPIGVGINLATWGIPGWGLSHVAIVANHPYFRFPVLFESTITATTPCIVTGELSRGVQAHHLPSRIADYPGRVWRYPCRHLLTETQSADLTGYLCGLIDNHVGYDALGAFRSRDTPLGFLERLFCRSNEDLSSLFCSELVAAAWRRIGLWHPRNASRWNPNALARAAIRWGVCKKPWRVK
jgi:hypothetical protein